MPVPSPLSKQDRQHPVKILFISRRRRWIAPLRIVRISGIRPGFFTINAINSAGSPPILKNSSPCSSTVSRKERCVASRTRWPCEARYFPIARKGWISPRDPTTWMTMFRRKGHRSSSPGGKHTEGLWSAGPRGYGCSLVWRAMRCSQGLFGVRFMLSRPSSILSVSIYTVGAIFQLSYPSPGRPCPGHGSRAPSGPG